MQGFLRWPAWGLFALLAYFIVSNIAHHWVLLPAPGNIGFVLAFTAFSLLHAGLMLGGRRLVLFFGLTVLISFIMEEVGVRTGWVFGRYHYSDMLGTKLGHVPVLIPLGWFMMIYPSWVVGRALLRGSDTRGPVGMIAVALAGALAMTGWDMVMDPPMIAGGNWIWEQGGPYFGVPLHNYFGWMLNLTVIYLAFGLAGRAIGRDEGYRFGGLFAALPVATYLLFTLEWLGPRREAPLILIACFTMLAPGLLALTRLLLPTGEQAA